MMKCYGCNEEIETDSRFCDQCGLENLVCTKCGTTGGTKFCEKCGGKMEVAKGGITISKDKPQYKKTKNKVEKTVSEEINNDATVRVAKKVMEITLVHSVTGTVLTFSGGDALGRKSGTYAEFFKQFSTISGSHGEIFVKDEKFCYKDLDSTNGSTYNKTSLDSSKAVVLKKGATLNLADQEFTVQ